MAATFKLIAKRDLRDSHAKIILGKGMSFELLTKYPSSASVNSLNSAEVRKAIKERYGAEVYINTVLGDFDVIKL